MAGDVVIIIEDWGRGLEVRNDESVARLRRFVQEAGAGERWAAVLPWVTRRDRHAWEERLRTAGFELRELDRDGRHDSSRAIRLLTLPAWVAIGISGRRTVTYQVTLRDPKGA